jgi:hypothetical protein
MTYENVRITVEQVENTRIIKARVVRLPEEESETEQTDEGDGKDETERTSEVEAEVEAKAEELSTD